MSGTEIRLDQIQRWMHTVITHPGGVHGGIASSAARQQIDVSAEEIENVIDRSAALNSIERLGIYGNAYYARLIECLAVEFPALRAAVGEDAFSGFVFGFLQHHPPASYTLSDLGRWFPIYLASSRPARQDDAPDWADFLVDLATLERTDSEVFDGPGEEHLPLLQAEELSAVPPENWSDIQFQTAASLRLLEFRFPVQDFAACVRRGAESTIPAAARTFLAVSRRDYIVRHRTLSRLPFQLLCFLQQGRTLGAAIEEAVVDTGAEEQRLVGQLGEWFRAWTRDGYFVSFRLNC
ncbi:MAG: putative DNA-binding domain-containing protein [Planctomycetaceae bacterium]|nr:putative DNA-binding domain-containing protein [Planctomycetaceae bacterium]